MMNPERHSLLVTAVALTAIVVGTTRAPQARPEDSHEKEVKDAAAQSAKAAKAFDEIMKVPERAIPQNLVARVALHLESPRVTTVMGTKCGSPPLDSAPVSRLA